MKTVTNIIYLAFALIAFSSPALIADQVCELDEDGELNCREVNPNLRNTLSGGFDPDCIEFLEIGNSAIGCKALNSIETLPTAAGGNFNTAVGIHAMEFTTTGSKNTAVGHRSLGKNIDGSHNTAVGEKALYSNITGDRNTASGWEALKDNQEGSGNVAGGVQALANNTTGNFNTATGVEALNHNATGSYNTANGVNVLHDNTTGSDNTAIGFEALHDNTTGFSNTALGLRAGIGVTTANNVICIGPNVGANVSNTTWIGNVYREHTQSGTTAPVVVSDGGQLGTVVSSERFKKDIATMNEASEAILSFRPVSFHYKTDTKGTPQFGLIAEEVAKVNPALVLPDKEGKPYTVRYDQVNAMLLNEFLKEHRKNEEQGRDIQEQKATIALQQKQIEALTAGLQKVSAQLETSKPAPRVVNN